jgi:hypothetical protein
MSDIPTDDIVDEVDYPPTDPGFPPEEQYRS